MRISFDLDDLLIPGIKQFPTEQRNFLHLLFRSEQLRKDTPALFRKLNEQGHELFIYTTSLRSPVKIKRLFLLHGTSLNGIYNKTAHERRMRTQSFTCSKYPPMFEIDLHIDDSQGVKTEAERYGFHVLIIDQKDDNWTQTILDFVDQLVRQESNPGLE